MLAFPEAHARSRAAINFRALLKSISNEGARFLKICHFGFAISFLLGLPMISAREASSRSESIFTELDMHPSAAPAPRQSQQQFNIPITNSTYPVLVHHAQIGHAAAVVHMPAAYEASVRGDTSSASDFGLHSASSFTAESSRRSEQQQVPYSYAPLGGPSSHSGSFNPHNHHFAHSGPPRAGSHPGHTALSRWPAGQQAAHQDERTSRYHNHYMQGNRWTVYSGDTPPMARRYEPGSVSADQSAFDFTHQRAASFMNPAPGAASDAFSRYTQHTNEGKQYYPSGPSRASGSAEQSLSQTLPQHDAGDGHPTRQQLPQSAVQRAVAPSMHSQHSIAYSSMHSHTMSATPSLHGAWARGGHQHAAPSLPTHTGTVSRASFAPTRSPSHVAAGHDTNQGINGALGAAVPRSESPLSLTKREKACAERDTLPPQFRGSRVLSFQPTENRWLTVYTEYKTRRQVRLYGSSAVSACLRRDFERIRSGIKPRINGRSKCTWLTLVDREMFAAFCSWRSQLDTTQRIAASGDSSDNLLWTGPTPDEMDEAAKRLGVSLAMHNWKEVCASAKQYAAGPVPPPGHLV